MKTTLPEEYTHEILALKAYRAYGDAVNWLNHRGEAMLAFEDTPMVIRQAWIAVVRALVPEDFRLHIDPPPISS